MKATTVVKLGGSLLEPPDFPGLPARLSQVLRECGGERPILLVGGGPTVDLVRRWDRLFNLGEEISHWISIRALSLNSRVVERLLPELCYLESAPGCLELWTRGRIPILDCFRFLKSVDNQRRDPLPRRWRVTSDSLAARVTQHFSAPELLLLKSADIPTGLKISEAVRLGYVDLHFTEAARGIPKISALNLRDPSARPTLLVNDGPGG